MPINLSGNELTSLGVKLLNDTNLITTNLLYLWDAGLISSYPGSGTSWFEWVNPSSNTGTLTNGPTYSSAGGGSILFDGTNDRVSTGIKPSGTRTYMIWIRYNSATGTGGFQLTGTQEVNAYTYTGRQDSGGLIYTYAGSGGNGGSSSYVLNTGVWYYQGFTLASNGDVGIYVNGSLIETKTGNGLGTTATNEFSIGCINENHFVNGNIAVVSLYNATLTSSQILQNFNGTRQRFGV
jgi:hypothetical protein